MDKWSFFPDRYSRTLFFPLSLKNRIQMLPRHIDHRTWPHVHLYNIKFICLSVILNDKNVIEKKVLLWPVSSEVVDMPGWIKVLRYFQVLLIKSPLPTCKPCLNSLSCETPPWSPYQGSLCIPPGSFRAQVSTRYIMIYEVGDYLFSLQLFEKDDDSQTCLRNVSQ